MRRGRFAARRQRAGIVLVSPLLLGFALFTLVPLAIVLVLSFFNWDLSGTAQFAGVGNFGQALGDPVFWHALLTTVVYIAYNLPVQWIVAMLLALVLQRALPGSGVFRLIFLIPWITTPIAVSTIWSWMLNPLTGVTNHVLQNFGLSAVDWFSEDNALRSIALVNVWQYTGYTALLFLVGLQSIPKDSLEAASLDGASSMRTFWHVKLPQMRPTLLFVFVTSVLGSFQVFDTVYALTQGGPGDSTRVLYYYIYEQAFSFSHFGYASALCVLLFVILLAVTSLQFRTFSDVSD